MQGCFYSSRNRTWTFWPSVYWAKPEKEATNFITPPTVVIGGGGRIHLLQKANAEQTQSAPFAALRTWSYCGALWLDGTWTTHWPTDSYIVSCSTSWTAVKALFFVRLWWSTIIRTDILCFRTFYQLFTLYLFLLLLTGRTRFKGALSEHCWKLD